MSTAHCQVARGYDSRAARHSGPAEPTDMVEYRNAHRVEGWALALVATSALWAVPVAAVVGIVSLF